MGATIFPEFPISSTASLAAVFWNSQLVKKRKSCDILIIVVVVITVPSSLLVHDSCTATPTVCLGSMAAAF